MGIFLIMRWTEEYQSAQRLGDVQKSLPNRAPWD